MSSPKLRQDLVPFVFFLLGLSLVVGLGIARRANDAERTRLETRNTAEQLKLRLESCFDSRAGLVRTLATYPWQSREQVVADWSERASSLLPLYSGVQALNYIDPDNVIRVIFPVAPNRAALDADLMQHPNESVKRALQRAGATGSMARTGIIDLLQGGKGFALYQPIYTAAGEPVGYVNGVFRVEALMNSCLPESRLQQNFAFVVADGDAGFFAQNDPLATGPGPYAVELQIAVVDAPWRLSIAPLTSYLAESDDYVDEAWIAFGVLLVALLALAFRSVLVKQQDMAAREEVYRLLVENQTDLVVKVDMQGRFEYVSPTYCEMFGKSEDELLGHQFMPLVHEDDRELTARSLERLHQPPHTAYHEQRAMTADGWRWLAWSNRAVLDDAGKPVAITAVGRDVTDIKRLEERVARSQKMQAMGELAGGITHDFNNLLQVLIGNIEFLLIDESLDRETRKSLERVRDVGMRGINLTKKLATLSRQEMPQPELFDVNRFLAELEDLLGHTLPASVQLEVAQGDGPLQVYGDRAQLEQVLLNLCFNARDAVDSKGRIRLHASRRTVPGDGAGLDVQLAAGDYVVLTVEDDGHGIDSETLPRIFDPFFTTKGKETGLGLGLANSYSIVEQHHGAIAVESTPGKGSCFSVYLPLATPAAGTAESAGPAPAPGAAQAGVPGGLVLVADDNPQLRELARKVLERAGYSVCTAEDGREAVRIYSERRQDIRFVILDLVMPEMGGEEAAKEIRALSRDARILFVSGFVPDQSKAALNYPILKKPYTIRDLTEAIGKLGEAPGAVES